jgi:hypothetical protein
MINNIELIKATIDRCTRTFKELLNFEMVFRNDKAGIIDYRQVDDINVAVMNSQNIYIIDYFAISCIFKIKNLPSPQKRLCLVNNFDLESIPMGVI